MYFFHTEKRWDYSIYTLSVDKKCKVTPAEDKTQYGIQ